MSGMEVVLQAFKEWDQNNTGVIGRPQLMSLMKVLQPTFAEADLAGLMDFAGGNANIDMVDYKRFLQRLAEAQDQPVIDGQSNVARIKSENKAAHSSLGIIRLDYDYPASPGDIDHPDSFGYDVFYRVVPGLTFEMCQMNTMTKDVESEFVEAIKWLEDKKVCGITGDCGFMMWFQMLARNHTQKPVFMSSLAQLPAVVCSLSRNEQIAVFTANATTLGPMENLIKDECGVDPIGEDRFLIIGCEDVPGFEAVALGAKVNVQAVMPGVVAKAVAVVEKHPNIRAFLFECTELPPYSDAVRFATGLPVYDSITCCDFFTSGSRDNKRFGLNGWQKNWDEKQEEYRYGMHLDSEDKAKLVNKAA